MRIYKKPVLCNYYVTYRCNASCHFCDIWEKPSPYVTMAHVEKNLIDLRKLGVKVIDFTGGEPLLHRDIAGILKMAKNLGFITTLTTNCLLYPKYSRKIQGLVDMLHFSLDFAEKELHDRSRGIKCFESVIKSIEISRSLGERPDILMTVMENNVDQIQRIYHEISFPNNLMLILNPVFDYNEVETSGSLSEGTLKEMEKWGRYPRVYLNEAFTELRRNGGNQIDDPVCKAGSSTIVISPQNELVLPCYHLGLDSIPIEDRLFELYQSDNTRHLISFEGRHQKCQGCTINCYMQPSFAVNVNKYWLKAIKGTLKYNYQKGTWKELVNA